jgi:MinD-like ATPase involved in chromosome partitioning or flagellar assembly
VESALKVKVAHELPLDRAVQVCVNRGEAVVLAEPRADFSKAIAALAKTLAPPLPASAKGQRKRLMSFARA